MTGKFADLVHVVGIVYAIIGGCSLALYLPPRPAPWLFVPISVGFLAGGVWLMSYQ